MGTGLLHLHLQNTNAPGALETNREVSAAEWEISACPPGDAPQEPSTWESLFSSMPAWRAADQGSSVQVADGRVLWLFNDTVAEHGQTSVLLRNSILLTRGSCTELDTSSETEFFESDSGHWWWPTHGVADGQSVWVVAGKYSGGAQAWDFEHEGDQLFQVNVTADSVDLIRDVAIPSEIDVNWSAGLATVDSYLVLFGVDQYLRLYVARTPIADPGRTWEYVGEGRQWTSDALQSVPGPYVGATSVSAVHTGEHWSIIFKPGGLVGAEIVELTAETLHGPFESTTVATVPVREEGPWTYNPVRHTWMSSGSGIGVLSLSRNVPNIEDVYRDYSLYRPEFLVIA